AGEQRLCDYRVSFPCSVCQQEIHLTRSFFHKKQHRALATLGLEWMGKKKPRSFEIAAQRQLIVSRLLSFLMFSERTLQKINYAYEVLWKKQKPVYYKILDNLDGTSTYLPKVSHLLIKGIATSGNRNSTWKVDMNDKFTIVNDFGNKPNVCFFGLFDGHRGDTAADMASKELPVLFLHQLTRCDPSYQMTAKEQHMINSFHIMFQEEYTSKEDAFFSTPKIKKNQGHKFEDIHKAFAKAYWRMDRLLELGRNEVSRVRWSGCSVVTCMLEGSIKNHGGTETNSLGSQRFAFHNKPWEVSGVLHVANTGDVQVVLCRNGKSFCLTKEHTTRNVNERKRVLENGVTISSDEPTGFLEGYIKTTRGLGFHGDPTLKKSVIPAPSTISVPIDNLCQFLILATNGLWEVFEVKEVTALAMTLFQTYKENVLLSGGGPQDGTQIHVLFQYKPESKECRSMTQFMKNSRHSEYCFYYPKNTETSPSKRAHSEPSSEKEPNIPTSTDGVQEPRDSSFYEGAAEYVSRELVTAALEAGSRDNITVTVIFLSGTEYQQLTQN
uniref:protein phosphatase 2C-like domain-containing protein 1 n=1 Tax=Jaculus jaculus TaxID=51337 RepID=UPI001E1B102B